MKVHIPSGVVTKLEGALWHNSGDLRASLKKAENSALLKHWQTGTSSQGDIARATDATVTRLLDAVRKTRDTRLFTFLVKAVTKQLAAADKLFPLPDAPVA